ncbi:MAG TPA: hypothetical protein VIH78_09395, partial [Terriglobales bacterium]
MVTCSTFAVAIHYPVKRRWGWYVCDAYVYTPHPHPIRPVYMYTPRFAHVCTHMFAAVYAMLERYGTRP